jgi:hypothetical protein
MVHRAAAAEMGLDGARMLSLLRRYTHDTRNHLNAMEMEVSQMELLKLDGDGEQSLKRMRRQMSEMEKDLRALAVRFMTPERGPVPAVDLYTLWTSRGRTFFPGNEIEWTCEIRGELLELDFKMVADALGEMLGRCKTAPARASARQVEGAVEYRVEWYPGAQGTSGLPEFELVIARNGGTYKEVPALDGASCRTAFCRFPLHVFPGS